jgi:hypothetical protein
MTVDQDTKFTFVFSVDETNLILTGLGAMPYTKVATLIENIKSQAHQQQAAQTTIDPDKETAS